MKILIDGQDDLISVKETFDPSLLLDSIESTLHAGNRAIQAFHFNDLSISRDDLQKEFESNPESASGTLSIETTDLHLYFCDLLNSLSAEIEEYEEEAVSIAETFLNVNNAESLNKLSVWSDNIVTLLENIIIFSNSYNVDTSNLSIAGKPYQEGIDQIKGFVSDICQAMEDDDRTQVADLLEFEIASLIAGLKDLLPVFKDRLDQVFNQKS